MAKSKIDQYANRAFSEVTMSAANTNTFEQIRFAVGVFQGVGLLLHRIQWFPGEASMREVVTAADRLTMALTLRDDLTSLEPTNQAVLAAVHYVGVAATTAPVTLPFETDWRQHPGGGLLIPSNPLYLAAGSGGFAAAATVRALIEYTFVQLSDREAIELLQTIIPGNI